VVLNLPLDVQAQEVPGPVPATVPVPPPAGAVRPSAQDAAALARLVGESSRPVFIAGRGARHAGTELKALAAEAGALLATSAVANGLFNGEEYNLGISGGFASPASAELVRGADLIVGFGCALNMWTMRHGSLVAEGAAVAQVDLEEAELGANRPVSLGVLGDTAATARDVLALLASGPDAAAAGAPRRYRTPEVAARIAAGARWQDVPVEDCSTPERIDPRLLTLELDRLLPADRIVSIDSGNFMGYPSTHLAVPDEAGFCFTQAFQSVGLGLGTAIGAALARPDRLPVLGTGDGGFLMGISELETAVRLGLPLVCIVYNDAAYGAEVHHFGGGGGADMSTVTFPDTDIAAIARGYGAGGVTVRSAADLAGVRAWLAGERNAPLVIDAKIASDGGAWWLAEAFTGH
jgi:thiamine pyrophosphate-dependent acetolactate synthase large subunit-like protein